MREVRWSGVRRILLIMSLTKQSRFSTVSNGVLHHSPPPFFPFFRLSPTPVTRPTCCTRTPHFRSLSPQAIVEREAHDTHEPGLPQILEH
jgi:hypothetical protein